MGPSLGLLSQCVPPSPSLHPDPTPMQIFADPLSSSFDGDSSEPLFPPEVMSPQDVEAWMRKEDDDKAQADKSWSAACSPAPLPKSEVEVRLVALSSLSRARSLSPPPSPLSLSLSLCLSWAAACRPMQYPAFLFNLRLYRMSKNSVWGGGESSRAKSARASTRSSAFV